MSTKTEGVHNAEFLLSEANGRLSRDEVTVTVPAETTLKPGTVLAQLSATDKYVEYDNAGTDGSEEAAGILVGELVNEAGEAADASGVVINFAAEVRSADLTWKTGLTDNDKAAGLADLKALGIKAR